MGRVEKRIASGGGLGDCDSSESGEEPLLEDGALESGDEAALRSESPAMVGGRVGAAGAQEQAGGRRARGGRSMRA